MIIFADSQKQAMPYPRVFESGKAEIQLAIMIAQQSNRVVEIVSPLITSWNHSRTTIGLTPVCPECRHLMTDNPHICPTEEYLRQRDMLLEAAMLDDPGEDGEEAYLRRVRAMTPLSQ